MLFEAAFPIHRKKYHAFIMDEVVTFEHVLQARDRIAPYLHKTPMLTSSTIDAMVPGREVYFKCENFQKTGSFKARGALNAVLRLSECDPDTPGVVTMSSGNHGQALAWASRACGMPCTVIVPDYTPQIKRDAIEGYGADLIIEASCEARYQLCRDIPERTGKVYISAHDHPDVIAGQGTIALEMLEEVPDLDAIFAMIGGGAMTAGSCLTMDHLRPQSKLFVVEPKGKNLEPCLRAGKRLWSGPQSFLDTLADGCKAQQVGHLTFPILRDLAQKDVFSVTNKEITEAMKLIFDRMKLVVEANAAGGLAAVLSERFRKMDPDIEKVGIILCGGNVNTFPWLNNSTQG